VWSATQRHALANSILVEYTNTFDFWYENASSRFHGGMITDVDAMAFMTQLNYSVPGSWCVFSMEVLGLSTLQLTC
jgi:hypothetical protein